MSKLIPVRSIVIVAGLAFSVLANAAGGPMGLWKTIDDETGKPKSMIRIVDNGGVLEGSIEKILPPGDPKAVCEKCPGPLKGQPVLGMKILTGMKPGDDGYKDGQIIDPSKGKSYKCLLWVDPDDPNKLIVRGYIGVSLFGRSQTWLRAE